MAESPKTTPIKVKKLGHVVFTVVDIERTTKFWTEIMGFHVSDRNERGMVFLRNASDHHTIALVPAESSHALPREGQPGFHHCALEVATVSELFKIRDFLRAKGVPIHYEGRRGPGGNPGVEFEDPELPGRVALTAFTPFVPLDADASGIPATVLRYSVTNPGKVPVSVTIAGSLSHLAGEATNFDDYIRSWFASPAARQTVSWRAPPTNQARTKSLKFLCSPAMCDREPAMVTDTGTSPGFVTE